MTNDEWHNECRNSIRHSTFVILKSFVRRILFSAERAEQHQHAEDQQHDAPNEIDVDVTAAGVRDGGALIDAIECQQRADEGEHQADWQSNVESHKFNLSVVVVMVHQKIKF